jgi:hypothetical protein
MPYIRISSLILVFFILFSKALAYVNDNATAAEERGIEADAHGSYETGKSKSVMTKITPGIAFIFAVPPDTWTWASSTILSSAAAAFPSCSPGREVSTTMPTIYFLSAKPTTASSSISLPGKRGTAYNNASLVSVFSKYPEVTWAYNWADVTLDIPSSIKYVPMLWGLGDYIQN